MSGIRFAASGGGAREVAADRLEVLLSGLKGRAVSRRDGDYEEVRSIWNAMIDTRPALIVSCAGPSDVARSVDFARDEGLVLSVRGAGHNIAGSSLAEDGLTIDLSGLREVEVHAESRTVRVAPGATLGDLDAATAAHGLAVPVGINSTTGVAGLTLGGGFGWLSRRLGLTVDSLLSADVVTAGGELVTCDAERHPDLFWAIRGGGGNFGVVTSFTFQAHDVGPDLLCGLVVHPFDDAGEVLRFYREFSGAEPDDLSTWMVLRHAPPLPFLPEEIHGRMVVVFAFVYSGAPAEGERAVRPLRDWGSPAGEHVGAMPFAEFQQAFDPLLTPGARNYWKSHNFAGLSDAALDLVVSWAGKLPSPESEIFFAHVGGAANRVDPDATAYPHRSAEYVMNVHTRWSDPGRDAACVSWAREFWEATAAEAEAGVYVNFVSDARDESQVRAAYGGNYQRLAAIKRTYDPENLFRTNLNVRPAPA
ncbi:MAG: FAD-binding oxidoreductase [Gemmatimonadota bacterium]|nr:FAD-binding oxidoreductase [Gemmatimonadota bacterium]